MGTIVFSFGCYHLTGSAKSPRVATEKQYAVALDV